MVPKVSLQYVIVAFPSYTHLLLVRLAPVIKTIFHQCVISYTCSQSNSDGSVLRASSVRLVTSTKVYDMTH